MHFIWGYYKHSKCYVKENYILDNIIIYLHGLSFSRSLKVFSVLVFINKLNMDSEYRDIWYSNLRTFVGDCSIDIMKSRYLFLL